jgi:putative hydrolase of the HAD superfamily
MVLRAVLFDFGDTLFERRGGWQLVVETATRLGYPVDDEVARALWRDVQLAARTPEELAKGRDLSAQAHRACWTALYRATDAIGPGMAEALYEVEAGVDGWVPFPDVAPTLAALAGRGVPIGVVSDTGWDIRPVLAAHGLDGFVGAYVLSFEHGVAKPAAVLFHQACAALGVSPAETVMVGDNPLTDGGAAAAGLASYILPGVEPGSPRGLAPVVALFGA